MPSGDACEIVEDGHDMPAQNWVIHPISPNLPPFAPRRYVRTPASKSAQWVASERAALRARRALRQRTSGNSAFTGQMWRYQVTSIVLQRTITASGRARRVKVARCVKRELKSAAEPLAARHTSLEAANSRRSANITPAHRLKGLHASKTGAALAARHGARSCGGWCGRAPAS